MVKPEREITAVTVDGFLFALIVLINVTILIQSDKQAEALKSIAKAIEKQDFKITLNNYKPEQPKTNRLTGLLPEVR